MWKSGYGKESSEQAFQLKTSEDKILPRIEEVREGLTELKKKFEKQQKQVMEGKIEELIGRAVSVNEFRIASGKWEDISPEMLREAAEKIRDKLKDVLVVLASINPRKAFLVATSTSKEIPANEIIKKVCLLAGGSGGGRWDFAQGGTPHLDKIDDALSKVPEIVKEMLER